jgi:hypothetical protein
MKLCECGCGLPAPISKTTRRGYRKAEPMRFIRGHFSRTAAASKPPVHVGPDNPKWRGDDTSIATLHAYVIRHFAKAGVCDQCGSATSTDYALIKDRQYSRDRDDYQELCRTCHNRYDGVIGRMAHGPDGRFVRKEVVPE